MRKYINYKDIFFKETMFKDIYFFNIGQEDCLSSHSYGPSIREHYLIHYITSGKGIYSANGITYTLETGDFFIIKPDEMTYYQADECQPWTYFWVGVSGSEVENLLKINGVTRHDYIGHVKNTNETEKLFETLFSHNLFDDSEKLMIQSNFLKLFSTFTIDERKIAAIKNDNRDQKYSSSFIHHVNNNFFRSELTITAIAQSMNLNSSYLTQVIKNEIDATPQKYLTNYRLQKASSLLTSSDMHINEVAFAVGYKSSDSFSRAFKKRFGESPSSFSERYKK